MVTKMIADYLKLLMIQGIKSILSMVNPAAAAGAAVTEAVPGLSDLNAPANINNPLGVMGAANGAVWQGGFTAFAAGGIVQGPTLGLVGEGKYNEAIIPLPDGKSVPVDLGGMSDGLGNNITSNIVVNVNSDGQSTSNANGSNSVDLGRKIEGAVKQVIVAELRPGGVLAGRR
jgi:phage-related minor tail protein